MFGDKRAVLIASRVSHSGSVANFDSWAWLRKVGNLNFYAMSS